MVVEKHILQLHVSVDDAFGIQSLNGANHLVHDIMALRWRQSRWNGSRKIHHEAAEIYLAVPVSDYWLVQHSSTDWNCAIPSRLLKLVFSKFAFELVDLGGVPFDSVDHAVYTDRKFRLLDFKGGSVDVGWNWWPWLVLGQVLEPFPVGKLRHWR